MPRPKEAISAIEADVFKRRLPGMPERERKKESVVRFEKPELSLEFSSLHEFIPTVDSVRIGTDNLLWTSFKYEDTAVDLPDRDPTKRYLVEKIRKYQDIDSLARGLGYIKDSYAPRVGLVTTRVRGVMEALQEISYALQEQGIDDTKLAGMSAAARAAFVNNHFSKSKSPEILGIMHQTFNALSRDAYKRINPEKSRIDLANTRPDIVSIQFKIRTIRNKNDRRLMAVLQEREIEKQSLQFAINTINHALNLTTGDDAFQRHEALMRKELHRLLSPDTVMVKPYAPVAADARFMLFATDKDRENPDAVEKLKRYVGEERAEELKKSKSYKSRDVGDRRELLRLFANQFEWVLKKSDQRLNNSMDALLFQPSFDEPMPRELTDGEVVDIN